MSGKQIILPVVIFLALMFVYTGLFIVKQNEEAVVLRLGKIERDSDNQAVVRYPGLQFKLPFITQVKIFDKRLQTLDVGSFRILTREQKAVLVDYYVKWRIENLPLYFTRVGGSSTRAQMLLQQKVNNDLSVQFGQRTVQEVVSGERADIMSILSKQTNEAAKELGLVVMDVRIKRIDLPAEVSNSVYQRMSTERQRKATEARARGRKEAEKIKAEADKTGRVILAKAREDALVIEGKGNAEAAKIYAKAYDKDREFFKFYRSLLAYKNAFNSHQDFLVLKPDSEFFKYFKQTNGAK